jgi:hypothetical protein
MAIIVFVQSHPYDAFPGGDGAYLQALARYLKESGHDVHGLVTNITRGRRNPLYMSTHPIDRYASWRVRTAWRLGRRTFIPLNPAGVLGILRKHLESLGLLSSRRVSTHEDWTPREALWVQQQIQKIHADVVILCFAAVHFAPFLSRVGAKILAMPGPLPGREITNRFDNGIGVASRDHQGQSVQLSTAQVALATALARADCVGFNSRDDMVYALQYLCANRGVVVGMGFPHHTALPESTQPIVLFVGNDSIYNRSAISWFLSSVWPIVLASCPTATFRIVGRIARVVDTAVTSSIKPVGPVRDLALEYRQAQVVIAPLVAGTSGVKIKVAEAMSYGRPLVTTSVGTDPSDKDQLDPAAIVANDPLDFARAVIALLQDPTLRNTKSRGAIEVFNKYFSYSACYGDLATWIHDR